MNNKSGFTVIEVVVVIGIIAGALAIAIPNFMGYLPKYRAKKAARDLYSNLQLAKIKAIKDDSNCVVTLSTGPDRYAISCLNKTVVLGGYGSGVNFDGPSGETFTGGAITINSRGMCVSSESIYLSNSGNSAYYMASALQSGVIQLQRWSGSSWTQSE